MSHAQLSQLLPLPDEELKQILDYASTLSKAEAAEHFNNLLGDSSQVIDFISSFNARRADPSTSSATAPSSGQSSEIDAVPKNRRGPKKKKPPLHTPAPRQVSSFALAPGTTAYHKKNQQDEYISGKPYTSTSANTGGPSRAPPIKSATPPPQPSKLPPSATGSLVSDLGLRKPNSKSNPTSRASTPGPSSRNNGSTTKVSIAGGVPMHGASTALSDLELAIRSLEITTNPSHASNTAAGIASRRCNCVGTQHPLLAATPNCLNCGKVICIKEGLGPCTFCGEPLLSSSEVQNMIKELRAERGRERMAADRDAHRRADVSVIPRPFTKPRTGSEDMSAAESRALEHRDRLLGYQAQNTQRTTVRDEAADFDVSLTGNMWASPEERALALKKQQKLMREMEWNALPEYDKRRQVVSIDLVGKKVFRKMTKIERPPSPDEVDEALVGAPLATTGGNKGYGGAFSRNPLLSGLVRPVYNAKGKGAELEGRKDKSTRWRRVQDDLENNEAVILDGGVYGASPGPGTEQVGDEPGRG
ncbi:putative zinc finger motif, C2HC5-type-domain-containing protein [Lasiosphaeria ovina]|uniref:Zinc finger motif, C2HC5-type-domain-containing protein n=1 Tax=Lasiosphaeria ovina TaxID=92902 RepID=A0AAE0MZD6_9PEZI|nr:putative zinc finger motif, C2HC5-type-domain-containing protein [Lasiosphaeria ovina]